MTNTYVPLQASARYKGFQQLAKKLRNHYPQPIKTNIRSGKNNYLLRIQLKNESEPWDSIAPIVIDQNLPDFNVGILKNRDDSINIEEIAKDNINQNEKYHT